MRKIIGSIVLLSAVGSVTAEATSHKLFAGTFSTADELKGYIKEGDSVTRSQSTVIPCESGTQFGTAYMLEIPQDLQKKGREHLFTETWTYPESFDQSATVASREIASKFKRQRSNPLFSGSVVTDGVNENAEFHLVVSREDETYLEHTFKVMGCSDDTLDDLQQALAMGDSGELICTMEKKMGSRIKQRVCRTQAEIDEERELLEFNVRQRSR